MLNRDNVYLSHLVNHQRLSLSMTHQKLTFSIAVKIGNQLVILMTRIEQLESDNILNDLPQQYNRK